MFFGTFWEHHTCFRNYHVLIISYLDAILCYSEEVGRTYLTKGVIEIIFYIQTSQL